MPLCIGAGVGAASSGGGHGPIIPAALLPPLVPSSSDESCSRSDGILVVFLADLIIAHSQQVKYRGSVLLQATRCFRAAVLLGLGTRMGERRGSAENDGVMPASAHTTPILGTDTLAMVEPWREEPWDEMGSHTQMRSRKFVERISCFPALPASYFSC